VASAVPSLQDGSGWTAAARLRAVLLQYADQLAVKVHGAMHRHNTSWLFHTGLMLRSTHRGIRCLTMFPPTETPAPETATPIRRLLQQ